MDPINSGGEVVDDTPTEPTDEIKQEAINKDEETHIKSEQEEAASADSGSEEDDDEDDVKVTIEDYNFRASQKHQPQQQQPKQPTVDFEAAQAVLDVDINSLEDKPWRKPGADLNDYFNYGFDESTWRMYCDRQKKMKAAVNEMVEVQETHRIPVISDFNKPTHQHPYQMPVVAPIVVQPSMVGPPPPHMQGDLGLNRMSRDHSSHRSRSSRNETTRHHSRSNTKERKRSRSRESSHRRSSGKDSRKRRSRSRETHEDRHKSKRHKSSRRV